MAIKITSSFEVGAPLPIDDRTVIATTTARDAIPAIQRYDGLAVYCLADNTTYQLQGGITNSDWVVVYGADGDLWDRIGTVLTPHTSGDSVTANDYRTTKQLGNIIGPNDWATNADFSDWTGSTPDEFTVWDFGGGSGSDVSQEAVIYQSAPYSVKLVGGSGGAPDKIIGRSVTGLTPSSGYGFGFSLKRETGIATYCQLILINGADLGTSTQQWIDSPYKIEYSGASGSFAQGDTWSTATGSGYISEVYPTYLVVTLGGGSVTMGQTITSGGSVTATVDADASTLTAGWYTIITNNPTSKLATISTDDWSLEGISLTAPASGTITLIWAAEDNKTLYLDDVIAATITTATGTVFDFSNASDISTISSPSKIIDFRFTGGTAGSAYNLNAGGFWASDYFTSWNFGALDVSIPQGDFTVTLGDSTVRDIQVDLITNNLSGADDDYIQHFFDAGSRTKSISVMSAGSSGTPIETLGFATSLTHVAANGDNISAAHSSIATYGLDAGEIVSAQRASITGDASDNADSYIGAFMAYGAASGGKGAGLLLDQRSTPFDYGVLSYGNDLILAASTAYGTTASGPDVILKAANASVTGDGGNVVAILGEGQSGENGAFEFWLGSTNFGKIYTDDKAAVLFESEATDAANTTAFYLYAYNDLVTDGAKILSLGDNIAGTPSEKLFVSLDGAVYTGVNASTSYYRAQGVFSHSDSTIGGSNFLAGVAGEASATSLKAGAGVIGFAQSTDAQNGYGAYFEVKPDASASAANAIGVEARSENTHAGGMNAAFKAHASGGATNYSFYGYSGDIFNAGKLLIGSTASATDYPNASAIISAVDTGFSSSAIAGLVLEAASTVSQQVYTLTSMAISGAQNGYSIFADARPSDSGDAGDSTALYASAASTHAGGENIAIRAEASSGSKNWSFFGVGGNVYNSGKVFIGSSVLGTDFTQSKMIVSQANTGATNTGLIGIVGEAASDGTDAAYGLYGYGLTKNAVGAAGVAGVGLAGNSAYTGPAYGGFFSAIDSHAGNNIAVNAVALNAGAGDAYSIQASGIARFSGQFAHAPSSTTSLSAGSTITITRGIMRVAGNGGAVTLTSTPTITAPVEDGTIVILQGDDDTNKVTLQDESSLAGTGLKLAGGNNITLGKGDMALLCYDAGDNKFYSIAPMSNN